MHVGIITIRKLVNFQTVPVAVYILLPWIPAIVGVLVIKYQILSQFVFRSVEIYRGGLELSTWQKITYFREDILLMTIVVPVIFISMALLISIRWTKVLVCILSIIIGLYLYIQYRSFCSVGEFVSLSLLHKAALNSVTFAVDYISLLDILIVAAIIGSPIILSKISLRQKHEDNNKNDKYKNIVTFYLVRSFPLMYCGMVFSLWFPFVKFPTVPMISSFNKNIVFQASGHSWEMPKNTHQDVPSDSADAILSQMKLLTNTDSFIQASEYDGVAQEANLIYFVMETVPYYAANLGSEIDDFLTLNILKKNSFIGLNHYSTYPYTTRATYSIYSGLYPSQEDQDYVSLYPELKIKGPISILRDKGYATAIFVPNPPKEFENEDVMFRQVGFTNAYYPSVTDLPWWSWLKRNSFASKYVVDRRTLDMLKDYILSQVKADSKFVVSFNPQLGHGPWEKSMEGMDYLTLKDRAKKLVQIQDRWLGEVVSLLDENKILNNTIIVVVADHGTRTREEQPDLRPLMEDRPFHVPFLVFAPKALSNTQLITQKTSHIDIAPTISKLMGLNTKGVYSEGLPIWSMELSKRTVFFLSGHYHGGNSYFGDGAFVSYNKRTGALYEKRGDYNIKLSDAIEVSRPKYRNLVKYIGNFISLQNMLASRIAFESKNLVLQRRTSDEVER